MMASVSMRRLGQAPLLGGMPLQQVGEVLGRAERPLARHLDQVDAAAGVEALQLLQQRGHVVLRLQVRAQVRARPAARRRQTAAPPECATARAGPPTAGGRRWRAARASPRAPTPRSASTARLGPARPRAASSGSGLCGTTVSFGGTISVPLFFCSVLAPTTHTQLKSRAATCAPSSRLRT